MKFLEKLQRRGTKPEQVRFTTSLGNSALPDINSIIDNVPIAWIQQGRIRKQDIARAAGYKNNPNRIATKIRKPTWRWLLQHRS